MMRKTLLALCLAGALLSPFVLAQSSSSSGTDSTVTSVSSSTGTDNGADGADIADVGASAGSSSSTGTTTTTSGSSSSTGTTTTTTTSSSTGSAGTTEGSATAPSIGGQTLCQKYTAALFSAQGGDTADNEYKLMQMVVGRAVLGNNTATTTGVNVPGIVAADSPTVKYFDGTNKFKTNPTNYVADYQANGLNNTAGFGGLATKLFGFFGEGLGCTLLPAYTGTRNMTAVHAGMNINNAEMTYFDNQVALSLLSFGADPADVNSAGVPYLSEFNRYPSLHDGTVFPQGSYSAAQANGYPITEREICKDVSCPIAPPAYSFCEKYANALYGYVNATSEQALITAVVGRAVLGSGGVASNGVTTRGIVGAGSPLLAFFNSTIQYRTNAPNYIASYLNHTADPFNGANGNDFGVLATHLVQFFGQPTVLGCRAPGYPAYAGNTDMRAVHAGMPITQAYFNDFVNQIADAAKSFGVSDSDAAIVGQALNGFLRADNTNSVCNQADCSCQPGVTKDANGNCGTQPTPNNNNNNGAALVSPSVAGMGVALVSAVVALLL